MGDHCARLMCKNRKGKCQEYDMRGSFGSATTFPLFSTVFQLHVCVGCYLIILRFLNLRWGSLYSSFSYSDSNRGSQPTHDKVPSAFLTKILFISIPHLKHFLLVSMRACTFSLRICSSARVRHALYTGSFHVSTTDSP